MKSNFEDVDFFFNELDPKVKKKAIEIAKRILKEKPLNEKEALKEGIKQAEAWFIDLEG